MMPRLIIGCLLAGVIAGMLLIAPAFAQDKKAIDYFHDGVAHYSSGDYHAAIDDYDKAIALDPDDAASYNNRGIAKRELGQHQSAEADFKKACQLDQTLSVC
ncbi:MAG: tetratricopeptide repeat protein [Candidatus Puniceispirillaceae bacterium]